MACINAQEEEEEEEEEEQPILLTLRDWHPLVDAAESNSADHLSPQTHNLCQWWLGSPAG